MPGASTRRKPKRVGRRRVRASQARRKRAGVQTNPKEESLMGVSDIIREIVGRASVVSSYSGKVEDYKHKKFHKATSIKHLAENDSNASYTLVQMPFCRSLKSEEQKLGKENASEPNSYRECNGDGGEHVEKVAQEKGSQSSDSSESGPLDTKNSSNGVYKPKFHCSMATSASSLPDVLDSEVASVSSRVEIAGSSGSLVVSRVLDKDKQFFNDRIDKIITKNETILAQAPSLRKKSRSSTCKSVIGFVTSNQESSAGAKNPHKVSTMSGGSAVEIMSCHEVASCYMNQRARLLSSSSCEVSSLSSSSSQEDIDFSNSNNSCHPRSARVPKKRRQLSPSTSILCGGEVSELPTKEFVTAPPKCFSNVSYNLRAGNCSGASVTVRTKSTHELNGDSNCLNPSDPIHPPNEVCQTKVAKMDMEAMSSLKTIMPALIVPPTVGQCSWERASKNVHVEKFVGSTACSSEQSMGLNELAPARACPIQGSTLKNAVKPSLINNQCEETVIKPTTDSINVTSGSTKNFQPKSSSMVKRPTSLMISNTLNATAVLPSPETPRALKPVSQSSIDGKSYTSIPMKISTRSSYTCLLKPQPMFIPQDSVPHLSMYSDWKTPDKESSDINNISTNDSRVNGRKSPRGWLYTNAYNHCNPTVVRSPDTEAPISSPGIKGAISFDAFRTSSSESIENNKPHKERSASLSSVDEAMGCSISTVSNSDTRCTTSRVLHRSSSTSSKESERVNAMQEPKAPIQDHSVFLNETGSKDSVIENAARTHDNRLKIQPEGLEICSKFEGTCESVQDRTVSVEKKPIVGGFESNEEYTYIRGRGRGRYVCDVCAIRCKKPSMLRKHLKTHTDHRPYTCDLCNFSFKTKGNLTKHEKSKSHHKKVAGKTGSASCSPSSCNAEGTNMSDTASDEGDSIDSDIDSDSQNEDASSSADNDCDKQEKLDKQEVAISLLNLSKTASTTPELASSYDLEPPPVTDACTRSSLDCLTSSPEKRDCPIDLSVKKVPNGIIHPKQTTPEKAAKHNLWSVDNEPRGPRECWPKWAKLTKPQDSTKCVEQMGTEFRSEADRKIELTNFPAHENFLPDVCSVPMLSPAKELASQPGSRESSAATSVITNTPSKKPKKLHQPWLSPTERKDSGFSEECSQDNRTCEDNSVKRNDSVIPSVDVITPSYGSNKVVSVIRSQEEFRVPAKAQMMTRELEGKPKCAECGKTFLKESQLYLHMQIHSLEKPHRCSPCGISFRSKSHLIKHRRSSSHDCKVYLTEAWGVANEENPRPFKCGDCKIAFRIHGHLAKHLRSKMHIMKMECLGKLPFGIYSEMEKQGNALNEIDTSDCEQSLKSLEGIAEKIYGNSWRERLTNATSEDAPE